MVTAAAAQWRIEFDYRSQVGQLDYVTHSPLAQRMLAEQYTGLRL